ncbi:MAG: hypothetical protein HYS13_13740 [Planctomycetia bacterium]|nr:hypothetical protein [Planctomycetia bacterium]
MTRSRFALVAFLGTFLTLGALGFPPPSRGTAADGPDTEKSPARVGQYDVYGYEEYPYEDYVPPQASGDDGPIEAPDVASEPDDAPLAADRAAEDVLNPGCDVCNQDGAAGPRHCGLNHPCAAIDEDASGETETSAGGRAAPRIDMAELAANYYHSIGNDEALEINLENEGLVPVATARNEEPSLVDIRASADSAYPECEYCECCEAPRPDGVAAEKIPDDADYRQYERRGCGWIDCGELQSGQPAAESPAYGEQAVSEAEDTVDSRSEPTGSGAAAAIQSTMDLLRRIGRGVIEFGRPRSIRADIPRVAPDSAEEGDDATEEEKSSAVWPADGDQG